MPRHLIGINDIILVGNFSDKDSVACFVLETNTRGIKLQAEGKQL